MKSESIALILATLIEITAIVFIYLFNALINNVSGGSSGGFVSSYGLYFFLLPVATVSMGIRLINSGREHLVIPLIIALPIVFIVMLSLLGMLLSLFAEPSVGLL